MARHIDDPDVLIRSLATRGHLGGLSAAVPAAIQLLGALGYDIVLLETVGVGQSEIEIAALADPTLVILNPGAGDAVQAAKAGLLEVADLLVVNKADREGAEQTVRDLRAESDAPILTLVAARGERITELAEAIEAHHRADTPQRRTARARAQILSLAQTHLRAHPDLDRLAAAVASGECDAYQAARTLLPAERRPEPRPLPHPRRMTALAAHPGDAETAPPPTNTTCAPAAAGVAAESAEFFGDRYDGTGSESGRRVHGTGTNLASAGGAVHRSGRRTMASWA